MPRDLTLNLNTEYSQDAPATAALAGGGYVAVWDDGNQDEGFDGFTGVYARVFDAQGRGLTTEIHVPLDDVGQQFGAEVVGLEDGGFVVAWNSNGADRANNDDDYIDVFLQRFSASGARIGGQVQVTPTRDGLDQRLEDLVTTADGGFRLTYAASNVDTDWNVYQQRFDDGARRIGGGVLINRDVDTGLASAFSVDTPGYQVAPLRNGGFVAAYSEYPGTGDGRQVFTQVYDARGDAIGARRQVSIADEFDQNEYPEIVTLSGGGYAVAWTHTEEDDLDDSDVMVRTYDDAGLALTAPVRVNVATPEGQDLGGLAALPGGGFLVTYSAYDAANSDFPYDYYGVNGRVYDANGRAVTGSIDISQFVYEDVESVGTTVLRDGGIVTTWNGGGSIDDDVYASLFAQGTKANDVISGALPGVVHGYSGNDSLLGSGYADTLYGDTGNDSLRGGGGADRLLGGAGADQLAGGAGADIFQFSALSDSTSAARDVILDFDALDRIALSTIDANTGRAGNQAFVLDRGGAFVAGEVRIVDAGRDLYVQLNVDADRFAESVILVKDVAALTAADFIL